MIIRKACSRDIAWIEEYARRDPETQVLVLHDIRHERDRSDFYVAISNDDLEGFMVVYKGFRDYYSVLIEARDKDVVQELVKTYKYTYGDYPAIIHVLDHFADAVRDLLNISTTHNYLVMALREEMPRRVFEPPEGYITKLKGNGLRELKYGNKIESRLKRLLEPYGIVVDDKIIAIGGYCAMEPEAYMICGVYVEPDYRGRGFGKAISSILVEKAFKHTDIVTLWVREDNYPAIYVYTGIGFKTIRRNTWINIGIDKKP